MSCYLTSYKAQPSGLLVMGQSPRVALRSHWGGLMGAESVRPRPPARMGGGLGVVRRCVRTDRLSHHPIRVRMPHQKRFIF